MKPVRKQRGSGGGRDKVTQNLVGHRLSRLSLPIRLLKLGVITGMKAERDFPLGCPCATLRPHHPRGNMQGLITYFF